MTPSARAAQQNEDGDSLGPVCVIYPTQSTKQPEMPQQQIDLSSGKSAHLNWAVLNGSAHENALTFRASRYDAATKITSYTDYQVTLKRSLSLESLSASANGVSVPLRYQTASGTQAEGYTATQSDYTVLVPAAARSLDLKLQAHGKLPKYGDEDVGYLVDGTPLPEDQTSSTRPVYELSLPLNGTPRFSPEDVCLIAVPCFGGRVPEIALERLAQTQGGGARAILLSVYGNRSDEDTLFELKGAAMRAGYVPMAAVRAVAQHSIVPAIAAGRPDEEDARRLAQFGRVIRDRLTEPNAPPLSLAKKELLRPFGGLPVHPRAGKACTGCGKCASLCPVGAIPSRDPSQTLETLCITCMRCVAVCPVHARRLSPLVVKLAGRKLKKKCARRQEPELIF